MKATYIIGKVVLENGETVEFSLGADGSIQRWGNTVENVSESIDVTEAMSEGILDAELWAEDDDS